MRQNLARLICDNLLSGLIAPSQLSTCVHVRVILECVGQAFSLPLDSSNTIESAVEIYRRWILEPKKQPPPIQEDEQFFYKEMFKHLSLVFTKRTSNESVENETTGKAIRQIQKDNSLQDAIHSHTNICNSVLDLFRNVGVSLKKKMMDDTWEVLLKIVLGIADAILSEPLNSSTVSENLVANILNVSYILQKL